MTRHARVELCYVAGCPSMASALENAQAALRAEGLVSEVIVRRVDSVAEARGYGLACRVYPEDGRSAGWPSVELIRAALRRRAIGDTVT